MSEPVLPALSGDETLLGLSADYRDLLTDAEHQEMNEGLAWIAATRREGRGRFSAHAHGLRLRRGQSGSSQ